MFKVDVKLIIFVVVGLLIFGLVGESFADQIDWVYSHEGKKEYKKSEVKNFLQRDDNNYYDGTPTFNEEDVLTILSPYDKKTYPCSTKKGNFWKAKITLQYESAYDPSGTTQTSGEQGYQALWVIVPQSVMGYEVGKIEKIFGNDQTVYLLPGKYAIGLVLFKSKKDYIIKDSVEICTVGLRIEDPIEKILLLPETFYGNAHKCGLAFGIVIDGPIDYADHVEEGYAKSEIFITKDWDDVNNLQNIDLNERSILAIPNSIFGTVPGKIMNNAKITFKFKVSFPGYSSTILTKIFKGRSKNKNKGEKKGKGKKKGKEKKSFTYYDPRIEVVQFGVNKKFYSSDKFDLAKRTTDQYRHRDDVKMRIRNMKRKLWSPEKDEDRLVTWYKDVVIGDAEFDNSGEDCELWVYSRHFPYKGVETFGSDPEYVEKETDRWQIQKWPSEGYGEIEKDGKRIDFYNIEWNRTGSNVSFYGFGKLSHFKTGVDFRAVFGKLSLDDLKNGDLSLVDNTYPFEDKRSANNTAGVYDTRKSTIRENRSKTAKLIMFGDTSNDLKLYFKSIRPNRVNSKFTLGYKGFGISLSNDSWGVTSPLFGYEETVIRREKQEILLAGKWFVNIFQDKISSKLNKEPEIDSATINNSIRNDNENSWSIKGCFYVTALDGANLCVDTTYNIEMAAYLKVGVNATKLNAGDIMEIKLGIKIKNFNYKKIPFTIKWP